MSDAILKVAGFIALRAAAAAASAVAVHYTRKALVAYERDRTAAALAAADAGDAQE